MGNDATLHRLKTNLEVIVGYRTCSILCIAPCLPTAPDSIFVK